MLPIAAAAAATTWTPTSVSCGADAAWRAGSVGRLTSSSPAALLQAEGLDDGNGHYMSLLQSRNALALPQAEPGHRVAELAVGHAVPATHLAELQAQDSHGPERAAASASATAAAMLTPGAVSRPGAGTPGGVEQEDQGQAATPAAPGLAPATVAVARTFVPRAAVVMPERPEQWAARRASTADPVRYTFTEVARAVAALAAEATASAGETLGGHPAGTPPSARSAADDENLEDEDAMLTPAALGAAIGVVVGAAVGVA